jgi:hypothetical protein
MLEGTRAKRRQRLKKQREGYLSLERVRATTKKCPGCQWQIEKNKGCDHMTYTRIEVI